MHSLALGVAMATGVGSEARLGNDTSLLYADWGREGLSLSTAFSLPRTTQISIPMHFSFSIILTIENLELKHGCSVELQRCSCPSFENACMLWILLA